MCDLCGKVEEGQPDLGPGAFLDYKSLDTSINIDSIKGVRISQARDVSYVGPQGVEQRHEVESVYVPWENLTNIIIHLIGIQIQEGKQD